MNKNDVLKRFKQLCEVKYTGSTPRTYTDQVRLFLDFSNKPPLRVNNEDILNYNISIRNKGASYRNVAINAIKAYFALVLKRKVKEFSSIRPKKEIRATKYFDYHTTKIKILAIPNLKHRAILLIGLMGWLRVSEVINLKCVDIIPDINRIDIKLSKGAKDRKVVMSDELYNILREYAFHYLKGKSLNDYVFEGQKGGKYSASSCNALVKTYLSKNMRFHDLRSTGATNAHINGASLLDISSNLGHSKIETTKFYIPDVRRSLLDVG